jgi:ribose transport system ATP-binding protein
MAAPQPGVRITIVTAALELTGIVKTFPGVRALNDVSFTCQPGEVHAIAGENGSGKSTLIKVAAGVLSPDAGTIAIGGTRLAHASPDRARALGLMTAYQDTALVRDLTVAQNCVLSWRKLGGAGAGAGAGAAEQVERRLRPFDLPFSLNARVAQLSPGSRQLLEVVRALASDPKVLVLDEPTAALDAGTAERLQDMLVRAAGQGVAVVYISHRLEEVARLAHRVTILRDGVVQATLDRGTWHIDEVVGLMVGAPLELAFPAKRGAIETGPPALRASGYTGYRFGPVDLHIQPGEVVGLAGAEMNGQREIVRALVGLLPAHGEVEIAGTERRITSPRRAENAGIQFLTGDRAAEAIFPPLAVMRNASVVRWGSLGPAGWISSRRERREFTRAAGALGITAAAPEQPIGQLSGGNQQKAVLARAVFKPSPILVLDEPTQGVDARTRLDIYRIIRGQAQQGTAVLVNSSDSAELAGLCDRVYVISRGRIVEELGGDAVSDHAIVEAFVNAKSAASAASAASAVADSHTDATGWRAKLPSLIGRSRSQLIPVAALVLLMLLVGAYGAVKSSSFLGSSNLSSLLITAVPILFVALGQLAVLVTAGFDISVGSAMSLAVVFVSLVAGSGSFLGVLPGIFAALGIGILIGLANGLVVRGLKVNAVIATIAMLSILSGLAIILRPQPGGLIGSGFTQAVGRQLGIVPVGILIAVVVAVAGDLILYRTTPGLAVRSTGLDEVASRRVGLRVGSIKVGAFVVCGVLAVVAGLFLAPQIGIGDNNVGAGYALPAFAACFLGGAGLRGGRGSFAATALGAMFLALLQNVAPLANISLGWVNVATGVLTILAVAAYASAGVGRAQRRRRDGNAIADLSQGEETVTHEPSASATQI